MSQDTQKSKHEVLARAGLVLSFFMFMLSAVVAFFCSQHAGYITGQNLLIDGGGYPGAL